MSGTTWPTLVAGAKAKASEVESKFDWIEGDFLPFSAGTKADATYDMGSSSYRWRDMYFSRQLLSPNGAVGTPAVSFVNDPDCGLYRIGANNWGLAAAGILGLELNASAHVRKPAQPCFLARQTAQANSFGGSVDVQVRYSTEVVDVNSDYNNATWIFTAPTTGKYLICAAGFFTGIEASAHVSGIFRLRTSLSAAVTYFDDYMYADNATASPDFLSGHISVVVPMTAGDTAQVNAQFDGSTDVDGAASTGWFSAMLIG